MKMKRMKKLAAAMLDGVMLCGSLVGCGGGSQSASDSGASADSGAAASTGDQAQITLIMALRDEWLSELEKAAQKAAGDIGGINLTTQDANNDVSKQLQYIETARNSGAQAIIVNMVDPSTAAQCVEAAGDIPVVFVNRYPTDDSVLNEKAVYVGSDEMTSGAFQAEWLANWCKEQGKTEVKYVMLNGTLGQTSTTNRTKSFEEGMKAAGINAIQAAEALACDFDRAKAMDKFTPLIGSTEFDVVVSNNDAMALGVVEALQSKGVDPTSLPILGIDASKDGRAAIKEGTLAMSVFQDPAGQGRGALYAAANLANGEDIAKDSGFEKDETGNILWVPFEPVTKDNVAEYDNR